MEAVKLVHNCDHLTPLCVDLDGTLLKTDLLWECILYLILNKPLSLFTLFIKLTKSKAAFKEFLAINFELNELPINNDVYNQVAEARRNGQRTILVSGTHQLLVKKISRKMEIFDEAHGTSNSINLIGKNKKEFLVDRYGEMGFDYIGDNAVDLHVWNAARKSFIVSGNSRLIAKVPNLEKSYKMPASKLLSLISAMRIYQWSKGALVFAPIFLAHKYFETDLMVKSIGAFISFGLIASTIYMFNDLCDITNDRTHPLKKARPLASGALPIPYALIAIPIVGMMALTVSYITAGLPLACILLLYVGINVLYSKWLKKTPIMDIFCLSSFYCLRILAGGVATGIVLSPWLKLFGFFLFLSLGFLKRHSELHYLYKEHGETASIGRGYGVADLQAIAIFGNASGLISVLVFCLYLYQNSNPELYQTPELLWGNIILLTFWILNIWLKSMRGMIKDDPIKYAMKNKESLITFFLIGVITIGAKYPFSQIKLFFK